MGIVTEVLGFDFGTSNTAVAYFDGEQVRPIELEPARMTIPTAVFFDETQAEMLVGTAANTSLTTGLDGRYMRSLKSVLGTTLMPEARHIHGRKTDFYEIISDFIAIVKARSEQQSGEAFTAVNAGRPVYFHKEGSEQEEQAENDLRQCFRMAGFDTINFILEPEAAALHSIRKFNTNATGLIVDIGGGTSDFTVFRYQNGSIDILSSYGLRLGGTDFDRLISFEHIMPCLGKGQKLKRTMGSGHIEAPNHVFADLATWEKIPFLYEPKTLRLVRSLLRDAVEPVYFRRLLHTLEDRLGHDIAFQAEDAKINFNRNPDALSIDLNIIEAGLTETLPPEKVLHRFAAFGDTLLAAIRRTIEIAEITPDEIDVVIPVGGSSAMQFVKQAIDAAVPTAELREELVFTSIAGGLAVGR